jgi:hypothetical protein
MAGKIDPNKVKQLVTKTQKTATKPKLIDALNKDKATFGDALKIFEDEAQYISQMNEMELANFANNLSDYFTVGGKKKNIPSNVVTTEGAPVSGKKLETLSERKGAKGEADTGSLQGSMQGLASLIDEIKGISPKMRNQMDRDELAAFIQKMRGRKFTNEEIKWVKAEMDEWGIGIAKEKATGMQYGKKLGAKSKEEFEFVKEYVDNLNSYSPKEFKANYGTVKNVNMDISNIIDSKLEKHFKKKYKWDDTKKDGGLDDATYEKYDDELYGAQKDFGDFHTVYDGGRDAFGMRKGRSWANHPNNYLDEASEKFESITGQGLNVDFFKKYTDDVLTKYVEPEKFQYGGQVIKGPDMGSTAHGSSELASRQRVLQPGGQMTTSTGLNYLLGEDDNNRIPFAGGKSVSPSDKTTTELLDINFDEDLDLKTIIRLLRQSQVGNQGDFSSGYQSKWRKADGGRIPFGTGGGIFSPNPDTSVKFNLDGETIFLNPDFFEAFMGPYMNDPKKFKRRTDDLKQEIRRNQGAVALADGGRIGFAGGGMGRRGFLKFLGGSFAGVAALKTGLAKLLGGKSAPEVKKVIDEIVVNNTTGAPDWFQPLVNKILKEGKDANITYGERQIGKVMDTPSGKVDVVYKLDSGEVELSFVGKDTALGEKVDLVYKPGQADEMTKGAKPADEFTAYESVPEGNVSSFGEDVDFTIDVGVKEADNVGELASDLSELKTLATGEKQTINEIVEGIKKKKTRAKMEGSGIDYITETQGDYPYASGGLAGMLGE